MIDLDSRDKEIFDDAVDAGAEAACEAVRGWNSRDLVIAETAAKVALERWIRDR